MNVTDELSKALKSKKAFDSITNDSKVLTMERDGTKLTIDFYSKNCRVDIGEDSQDGVVSQHLIDEAIKKTTDSEPVEKDDAE